MEAIQEVCDDNSYHKVSVPYYMLAYAIVDEELGPRSVHRTNFSTSASASMGRLG